RRLTPLAKAVRLPEYEDRSINLASEATTLLLFLTALPTLVITLYAAGQSLDHKPVTGPDAASLFCRVGAGLNYLLPPLHVTITILGHAIRERSAFLTFLAGLILNLAVSLSYAL